MRRIPHYLVLIVVMYTIMPALWAIFMFLGLIRKIKIVNPENLPKSWSKSLPMIIVTNHPDLFEHMYEVFLLPALLFPQSFLHPFMLAPWLMPDKHNFTDKWYWRWLKVRAIPVQRDKPNCGRNEAKGIYKAFSSNSIAILFSPGRDRNGTEFIVSPSGKRKMRKPTELVAWLAQKSGASILPIWTETRSTLSQPKKQLFSWPQYKGTVKVKVGKPIHLSNEMKAMDKSQLNQLIFSKLLETADQ